eukprot:147223-Amphidinium_carterae.1
MADVYCVSDREERRQAKKEKLRAEKQFSFAAIRMEALMGQQRYVRWEGGHLETMPDHSVHAIQQVEDWSVSTPMQNLIQRSTQTIMLGRHAVTIQAFWNVQSALFTLSKRDATLSRAFHTCRM